MHKHTGELQDLEEREREGVIICIGNLSAFYVNVISSIAYYLHYLQPRRCLASAALLHCHVILNKDSQQTQIYENYKHLYLECQKNTRRHNPTCQIRWLEVDLKPRAP